MFFFEKHKWFCEYCTHYYDYSKFRKIKYSDIICINQQFFITNNIDREIPKDIPLENIYRNVDQWKNHWVGLIRAADELVSPYLLSLVPFTDMVTDEDGNTSCLLVQCETTIRYGYIHIAMCNKDGRLYIYSLCHSYREYLVEVSKWKKYVKAGDETFIEYISMDRTTQGRNQPLFPFKDVSSVKNGNRS
jgi:hypothetical protein